MILKTLDNELNNIKTELSQFESLPASNSSINMCIV